MSKDQSIERILEKIAFSSGAILQPLNKAFLYGSAAALKSDAWAPSLVIRQCSQKELAGE